jgi:hypothetical protein
MTHLPFTHQLYVFTPSLANREEVERGFPLRKTEGMMPSPLRYVYIYLVGRMNEEQVKWLVAQKDKGKIGGWNVSTISVF